MIVVKYIGAAFLAWIVALIIRGFYTSHEVRLQVYLKPLTHSYFRLGLYFVKEVWMDKNVEVLTLGMFFIVLEIHFIEESDNKDLLIKEFLADVDVTTQSDDSSVQP